MSNRRTWISVPYCSMLRSCVPCACGGRANPLCVHEMLRGNRMDLQPTRQTRFARNWTVDACHGLCVELSCFVLVTVSRCFCNAGCWAQPSSIVGRRCENHSPLPLQLIRNSYILESAKSRLPQKPLQTLVLIDILTIPDFQRGGVLCALQSGSTV